MIPFAAPSDDILFSMRVVADAAGLAAWDDDLAQDILQAFARFAEAELAPINARGDRAGCVLDQGRVRMPSGFAEVYAQVAAMGWQGLSAPEPYGGMGQGPLVAAMVSEVFSGANHALQMLCNLVPGAIATLLAHGTDRQQAE